MPPTLRKEAPTRGPIPTPRPPFRNPPSRPLLHKGFVSLLYPPCLKLTVVQFLFVRERIPSCFAAVFQKELPARAIFSPCPFYPRIVLCIRFVSLPNRIGSGCSPSMTKSALSGFHRTGRTSLCIQLFGLLCFLHDLLGHKGRRFFITLKGQGEISPAMGHLAQIGGKVRHFRHRHLGADLL